MAIHGVGIKADLSVEAFQLPLLGDDQRIDFEHRHVGLDEGPVELTDQRARLFGKLAGEAEDLRDLPAMMRLDAGRGVDRETVDLFRRVMRDALDVHATLCRDDEGDARSLAIDQHGEVELLLDIGAVLNVEAVDLLAVRPGLHGDERMAEHLGRVALHLVNVESETHAALGLGGEFLELALAAPASMDLALHHIERTWKLFCRLDGLFRRQGRKSGGHRRAEGLQDGFGLVFMDVHGSLCSGSSRWAVGNRSG